MSYIEKYSSGILTMLFIIGWIIVILNWLIANPLMSLKEILYYFHLMFEIILVPFFFNLLSIIHKGGQTKKKTIMNLSYGIFVWILSQFIGLTQFDENSFLVFYLVQMSAAICVVFINYIIIDRKIKKGIFISLYNLCYSFIFLYLTIVVFEFSNIPLFLTIITMVIFWFVFITNTLVLIFYKKLRPEKPYYRL